MSKQSSARRVRDASRARAAKPLALSLALTALLGATGAWAGKSDALEAKSLGVAVYPGAKPDADTTEFVRTSLSVNGIAFRSSDDLAKVAAFYAKQGGVKPMGAATSESAAFSAGCKEEYNAILKKKMSTGCDLNITVQNPWMDMKSGKKVNDTLITIVKQR